MHDYNYCWPGLEPKSLDPESRAFAAVSPTTRTTKVTEVSPTTFSLCVMKLNVNFNQILSTQFFFGEYRVFLGALVSLPLFVL